jgi:hypothetical protein
MSLFVSPQGVVTVTVPAGQSIAVFTQGQCTVSRVSNFPNYPSRSAVVGTVTGGQTVFGSFTTATQIIIDASGGRVVFYEVGTSPSVQQERLLAPTQVTPGVLNATGTLTAAMLLTGIVTSTSAAAVTATLDTGTIMDAASSWLVDESTDWSVINTGPNAFTVTASAGHTIVGTAAVATVTSGQFRTRKTAANTFVTYRVG